MNQTFDEFGVSAAEAVNDSDFGVSVKKMASELYGYFVESAKEHIFEDSCLKQRVMDSNSGDSSTPSSNFIQQPWQRFVAWKS
eukprot:449889-Lingulodinium_polyedra.AAC.1